jgi:hypothetical protein
MQTVQSATVPYATPAQFLATYDYRPAGQLVRDDGTQAGSSDLTVPDANLQWALMEATGEIEMMASIGQRYSPTDLQNLANSNTAGAAILAKMTCDIAAEYLRERRLIPAINPYPAYLRAQQKLDALATGGAIFPFTEAAKAGVADNYTFNQTDIDNVNLITRNRFAWGVRGSYGVGFPGSSAGMG